MDKRCPRCGGNIFVDYDEEYCLQCSYTVPSKKPLKVFIQQYEMEQTLREAMNGYHIQEPKIINRTGLSWLGK